MTPEQWLSEQIKEKGIKQRYLAQKTGISENKISASLIGRRRIKVSEIIAICNVAGIDLTKCPVSPAEGDANA